MVHHIDGIPEKYYSVPMKPPKESKSRVLWFKNIPYLRLIDPTRRAAQSASPAESPPGFGSSPSEEKSYRWRLPYLDSKTGFSTVTYRSMFGTVPKRLPNAIFSELQAVISYCSALSRFCGEPVSRIVFLCFLVLQKYERRPSETYR